MLQLGYLWAKSKKQLLHHNHTILPLYSLCNFFALSPYWFFHLWTGLLLIQCYSPHLSHIKFTKPKPKQIKTVTVNTLHWFYNWKLSAMQITDNTVPTHSREMNKQKKFITCIVYIVHKINFYFLFYPHILPCMLLAVWSSYIYYRVELLNPSVPMSRIKK